MNSTWLYRQESDRFQVSLYTQNEIDNAESQRDLTPMITLMDNSINYSTYNQSYFRILSAMGIDNLESTSAFYSLSHIITSSNGIILYVL